MSSYVKVSNERLNTLVDIVGELVINQSMVKQVLESYSNDALDDRIIQQLESITTNIKNLVLSMGMVPISDIFNKLRVVIRNTAMELQKVVSLEISGENTELDRNVIQAIYDPLIHIVRNAVDHGLELPKDREKAGKNKVGKVLIKAEHKGNGIEISVFDDGRGINKEKIIKKAIEKKIYEPAQIESMKEKEIFNLIFLPGFSTAEKVTEVSGRGVGLDVVKKNIEDIRGKIEIESELGKFTKIIIKLPLTLAIIDGFVTEVAGNKYIFPFALIEEIIEPSTVKVNQLENGQIMLQSRGIYIPVIFAEKIFKSLHGDKNKDIDRYLIIIISYEEKFIGIAVDTIIGKQEIVIKSLGEMLQGLKIFSGGTIFGDGSIGFVVDIEEFISKAKQIQ